LHQPCQTVVEPHLTAFVVVAHIAHGQTGAVCCHKAVAVNALRQTVCQKHHGNTQHKVQAFVVQFDLIEKFTSFKMADTWLACHLPKVFYLWGHAYEFDDKNNWDRMEEICEKLANKDDTWYATNIEIYDYVQAYNSLIFSADSNKIYNPTLQKIWLEIDGVDYSIEPGETLKIN
jgi:hypothetical protein